MRACLSISSCNFLFKSWISSTRVSISLVCLSDLISSLNLYFRSSINRYYFFYCFFNNYMNLLLIINHYVNLCESSLNQYMMYNSKFALFYNIFKFEINRFLNDLYDVCKFSKKSSAEESKTSISLFYKGVFVLVFWKYINFNFWY